MPKVASKRKDLSMDPKDPKPEALAEENLRLELMERFRAASTNEKGWNDAAKEDHAFALGDQWKADDIQKLKNQGRPAMTFNRIRPLINLVSGYQRENSSRIKVNPEGGEDRIFSEVMDRAIKQVDKWAHLSHKMSYWFDDGLFTGKGWLEAVLTYEQDPVKGELHFLQRTPYQVLVDPEHNEYDLNEWPRAQYVFKLVRLTRDQLKLLYPSKAALISGFVKDSDDRMENGAGILKEGSDDDYANRPNVTTVVKATNGMMPESKLHRDNRFTVKEYWRPKMVDRYFVIDKEEGEPRKFDTKEAADDFVEEQGFGKPIKRSVPEMWVTAMVGGFMMPDEKSPFEPFYSGYPFFRFLADWAPSAETEELKTQGLVRPLKDPQREKNKTKSQILHILNTQANSGWIGDSDALSKEGWKALENMGSKPGITVKKKRGRELREILPKGPNIGHLNREEKADEEFKQISGVNPDLLGFQDKTESGRAISMRIRQAVLSLVRIFHNYRYSKEILGKFILEMMPATFDAKKLKKVLGPHYLRTAIDEETHPEGVTDGVLEGFLQMVKDHKYDVFVAEADQNKTIRFEIFQMLTELVKVGFPVPPDLVVDYMDLPNSEEVKKKVQEQQERQAQAAAAKTGQ